MAKHTEVATNIEQRGVFINVVVNHPKGVFAGINATGLIDTGADHILISRSIARQVKLRSFGDQELGAIGGTTVIGTLHGSFPFNRAAQLTSYSDS